MRITGPVERIIHKPSSSRRRQRLRVRQCSETPNENCESFQIKRELSSCHSEARCKRQIHPGHTCSENWLDGLPPEVCTRIAHFARQNETTDYDSGSILNLAEVSEKQGKAVVEAFAHELRFPLEDAQRWASIFRMHIRKLSTGCFLNETVCHLLRSPTLLSVTIPNFSVYLEAISRAPRLMALSIELADRSPLEPFVRSVHIFLTALKALNLRELRIKCVGICVFKDVFRTREAWLELAGLCPNLSTLEIVCICGSKEVELSHFVNNLPRLQRFTFNRPVSKRTLLALRQIESVSLRHVWDGGLSMREQCELAVKIGEPVTGIESTFFPLCARPSLLTEDGVASLSKCKRLSELDMHLRAGAERSFPNLPELCSLRMRWEDSSVDLLHGQGGRDRFHAPSPPFFIQVASMAPNLRTLCLFKIQISLIELTEMLSRVGSRLEIFGTSITGQDEPAEVRTVQVLDILARNNRSLQNFEIFGYPQLHPSQSTAAFCRHWRRRIQCAMKVLQRRCPQFDNRELRQFIQKWLVPRIRQSNAQCIS